MDFVRIDLSLINVFEIFGAAFIQVGFSGKKLQKNANHISMFEQPVLHLMSHEDSSPRMYLDAYIYQACL